MSISLPIKHDISVSCEECKQITNSNILIEDLELGNSYERQMGTQIQYDFTAEAICSNCGHRFQVNGELWEYPEGVINSIQIVE